MVCTLSMVPPAESARIADSVSATGRASWCFVGSPPGVRQGWKLYVSANNGNFAQVLDAIHPILARHAMPYKHAADQRVLQRINAGLDGYSQVGKAIVVYIDDDSRALPLLDDLKVALQPFAHSAVLPPFAEPVGGGLPLSYRYGAFEGDQIAIGGVTIADDRTRKMSALDGLPADPFAPAVAPAAPDEGLRKLLLRFPVFEVLSQSGKGGVYAAMDLGSPVFREVILKIGRRNGNLLPDGRDALDLVRREKWFFDTATAHGLAQYVPVVAGYWEFPSSAVLIMERIEGETLQNTRARDALKIEHIRASMKILEAFHAQGLIAGDAKLGNFILTPSEALKIIDFESGGFIHEAQGRDQYSTFLFTDRRLERHPAAREKLHFLYSAVHDEGEGAFDEASRLIDLSAVIAAPPRSDLAAATLALMREIFGDHCREGEQKFN